MYTGNRMGPTEKQLAARWKPGQSGNINGRPIGARQKIAEAIIRDVSDAWGKHGPVVLARPAKTEPGTFAKLAAGLVPKEFELSIGAKLPGGMDGEDWQILSEVLAAVRSSMPDAGSREPGEVLRFVQQALDAHSAPLIEAENEA
jgi:hypothetical protein